MNARQAAKAAAKHIEELEDYNNRATATIQGLYKCIEIMFKGGNVCEHCDDYEECQLKAKEEGKGCEDWVMEDITPEDVKEVSDDSEGVHVECASGRTGTARH